ncbi:MAG: guanylate kinase [Ruminococcaceae bacterium]|nr:guanylate kinase [Oscillospiraceae bacterium]
MNKRGKVLIVSGSAGSGKSTVLTPFKSGEIEPFVFSVSATTRKARPGEVDGRDYLFVTKERFEEMIEKGELIEHTTFNGNYYGTPKGPLEKQIEEGKIVILEIEVDGAEQIMSLFDPNDIVSVFLSPPDYKTLEKRLRGRGTNTEADIIERLERAKVELEYSSLYKNILINYDSRANDVTEAIIAITKGENIKTPDIYCQSKEQLIDKFYN